MVSDIINLPKFRYETVPINELKAEGHVDDKGKLHVERLLFSGAEVRPTSRFWNSLCARFGFGPSIFTYFSHEEVFTRISERAKHAIVKLTIQETPSGDEWVSSDGYRPKLLGVASARKSMIHSDEAIRVLNMLSTTQAVKYKDGMFVSEHDLSRPFDWDIGNDCHHARIYLETPVDGYGRPTLFLSLHRVRCLNELVARGKAFRSGVILGKDAVVDTLYRAMESYSNESGFCALRDRLITSQKSWASVRECVQLSKVLAPLTPDDFSPAFVQSVPAAGEDPESLRNGVLKRLYEITGNLNQIYGVAQLETLTEKQMQMTASQAKVYDLICFASELGTHQLRPESASRLHHYMGRILGSDIFDLENSCDEFPVFSDFIDDNSREAAKKKEVA
jgi:hypothetical protein